MPATHRYIWIAVILAALIGGAAAAPARAQQFPELVKDLNQKSFSKKIAAVEAVAASGHDRAEPILRAMVNGDLFERESDKLIVIGARQPDRSYALTDAITGEDAGSAKSRDLDKIRTNNRLRGIINAAIGTLALQSKDPQKRLAAAQAVFDAQDADALGALSRAMEKESDPEIRKAMAEARASALLSSDAPDAEKLEAVAVLLDRGGRDALDILFSASRGEGDVAEASQAAVKSIQDRLALWAGVQNAIYGLSLGSVLLLAAIGLAITFGVLGVINMAHGEMVMIGAYTTFVVQEIIRTSMPGLFEWSLLIAIPLAFLTAGIVGIAIERGVIRWLYGRPLETLLATWGLSLILQQAVRSIFGPTNREVGNPDWMSGSVALGELTLTMNRLYIICFALAVFAVLLLVFNKTSFGLKMRAVVQNRRMAANMGIRTPWVDAMTFGLGSGIAGIAGVALSQIDNVSPNLGQSYIIDSFLVVVFGGVGNLWGTLVGAMTLGIANKFLEPYSGAVLAKILVLVFIILFIQKRPRGLFALKGRAVES